MANTYVYVTDEVKRLIELVSAADCRTQNGEIEHLFKQRAKALGILDVTHPSNEVKDVNKPETDGAGNA